MNTTAHENIKLIKQFYRYARKGDSDNAKAFLSFGIEFRERTPSLASSDKHTGAAAVLEEALGPIDISVLFVPAPAMKDAALDAINAGVKLAVLVADRVPVWDAMEIAAAARARRASCVGPNTLGIASPGKAVVGMIGGRAESAREWFMPPLPGGTGVRPKPTR